MIAASKRKAETKSIITKNRKRRIKK